MPNAGPQPLGGPVAITPGTGRLAVSSSALEGSGTVLPGLLMQTVVTPYGKTQDGDIIRVIIEPWLDIIDALLKDPDLAYKLEPRQLEALVAAAWDRAGAARVELTPRSGDLGRDVIATFDGIGTFHHIGTMRVIDQVKRYSPDNLVTAEHARALLLVLDADKGTKGFLTTTSDFAPRIEEDRFIRPYIGPRLELVNRAKLLAWFKELAKK
jgi:restriction system protein